MKITKKLFKLSKKKHKAELLKIISQSFNLVAHAAEQAEYTFYDTFDWSLFNNGYTLNHRKNMLSLYALNQGELFQSIKISSIPKFYWDLPGSPLKKTLASLLKTRALLKLVTVVKKTNKMTVLNKNQKTITRIFWQGIGIKMKQRIRNVGLFLETEKIRGYNQAFNKINTLLSRLEYIIETDSIFYACLKAINKLPGSYSDKMKVKLSPETKIINAAQKILLHLLNIIRINENWVKQDIDTEFLHDFRVAIRRTRSFLSQIKNIFPQEQINKHKENLRYLARLTNQQRDMDVFILQLKEYKKAIPESLIKGFSQLNDFISHLRQEAHGKLIQALNAKTYSTILAEWTNFLKKNWNKTKAGAEAGTLVLQIAKNRIHSQFKSIIKKGNKIDNTSPSEKLHRLRIECKKLRYLIEFFRSLFPEQRIKYLIDQLKLLQDNLGSFQDLFFQRYTLEQIIKKITTEKQDQTEIIMTIGFLRAYIEQEQKRIRNKFAGTFSKFNSRQVEVLFNELFQST